MSRQDGPPILISDEWQRWTEPPQTADAESESADPPTTEPDPVRPDEPIESTEPTGEAAEAPTPIQETSGQQGQEPAPEAPVVEAAPDHLAMIQAELSILRAETVHLNEILDRMHAENERLRRGESEQLLQPLFRDLLKLADDWTAMATSWESKEAATPSDVARKCRDVAEDAGLILERHGVASLVPQVGTPIERRQHRVVGTVKAETPEVDNTVVEVRRPGYVYGEKVIKFAEVIAAKA
jgi:molecular chaperone GrpE (heat shock protein)